MGSKSVITAVGQKVFEDIFAEPIELFVPPGQALDVVRKRLNF